MTEKQIKYILKNFKRGTTILFMGVSFNQYINLEQLTEAGYTCILLGEGQDYWPYIQDNMIIYVDNIDIKIMRLNCYPLHCPIFVYDKNRVMNAEDKDVRVWAEVLKEV